MKQWLKYSAAVLVALLAACGGTNPPGGNNSVPIKAATGGTVEVGGAKLIIPAGVLSQDANVSLEVKAKPSEPGGNPMQAAGPAVNLNLGGASLKQGATLELPVSEVNADGNLVVLETVANPGEGEPALWVHAAKPVTAAKPLEVSATSVSAQTLPSKVAYSVSRAGLYTSYMVAKPKPSELVNGVSLQVPFYYQAGLPWCTPTSLSMALNYYKPLAALASNPKFPGGFASNFGLASLIKQSASSGSGADSILKAAGVPASSYKFMRWDAELVPADTTPSDGAFGAFQSYVALATTGVFGLTAPQPVWTSSDRLWHAFVITGFTGKNIDGIYLNDSNARWMGTHPAQSWKDFREANCTLKDDKDPSKGCQDKGAANDPDLFTLVIYSDAKPETERRGSIELSHGDTIYFGGTPVPFSASLLFRNPSSQVISRWKWEGAYPNGYYYNDEATTLNTFPFGSNLVQDTEFKYLIYKSSRMELSFNVVNVTNVALDYEVEARLFVGGSNKAQKFSNVNVGAYSLGAVNINFGNLADVAGAIGAPTAARVEINLRQNGALQDVKHIAFKLAPDPTNLPTVRFLVPKTTTTVLKGEPFTFKGEGFDAHTLPDGRARLSWFEGGVPKIGNGGQYSITPNSVGTRTVTLVATGEYGLQATTSVSVNVIDPTRTPGEIVIVSPANNAQYEHPQFQTAEVPLVGYATYSNGVAVPGDKLVWTLDGQAGEIGRGSSLSVKLSGGVSPGNYTIRMTALSADNQPIGSKTASVKVFCVVCVN